MYQFQTKPLLNELSLGYSKQFQTFKAKADTLVEMASEWKRQHKFGISKMLRMNATHRISLISLKRNLQSCQKI